MGRVSRGLSRRDFLKIGALTAGAAGLAACVPESVRSQFCSGGLTVPPGCNSKGSITDPQQVIEGMADTASLGPGIPPEFFSAVNDAVADYRTTGGIIEFGQNLFFDNRSISPTDQIAIWQQITQEANNKRVPIVVEIGPGNYPNPIPGAVVLGIDGQYRLTDFSSESPYYDFNMFINKHVSADQLLNNVPEVLMASPYPMVDVDGVDRGMGESVDPRSLISWVLEGLPQGGHIVIIPDPKTFSYENLTAYKTFFADNNIDYEYFYALQYAATSYPDLLSLQGQINSEYFRLDETPYVPVIVVNK